MYSEDGDWEEANYDQSVSWAETIHHTLHSHFNATMNIKYRPKITSALCPRQLMAVTVTERVGAVDKRTPSKTNGSPKQCVMISM